MTRTILFVCEHGAFRSCIAAAYFNAARPLGWRALSAGRDPQSTVSARLGPLLAGTAAAEYLETEAPRRAGDVIADRVIALDSRMAARLSGRRVPTRMWRCATSSPRGSRFWLGA